MAVEIGRKGFVGVAFETSAGAGGDTPVKYIPYTANSMHNVIEVLDDEAAKGIRERAWGSVSARTRGEGAITILADVENLPYFLFPALGVDVVQPIVAGKSYQHTFTRKAGNPPVTICLNVNDTVETRKFHYGAVNSLELTFSDGFVEVTSNILSKAPDAGAGTLSITEENVLAFKDAKIYFGTSLNQAVSKYQNASGAEELTAFSLTINNNSVAQYESGSSSPGQISMGQLEIGGNYTLFMEDTVERAAIEAQTKRAMVVSITGGTITGTSTTEEILIMIPQFHITDRGIDTAPAGFVTENPTFVADYTSANGSITIKVINETMSYPGCTVSSLSSSCSSSSTSSCSSSYSSSSFSSY